MNEDKIKKLECEKLEEFKEDDKKEIDKRIKEISKVPDIKLYYLVGKIGDESAYINREENIMTSPTSTEYGIDVDNKLVGYDIKTLVEITKTIERLEEYKNEKSEGYVDFDVEEKIKEEKDFSDMKSLEMKYKKRIDKKIKEEIDKKEQERLERDAEHKEMIERAKLAKDGILKGRHVTITNKKLFEFDSGDIYNFDEALLIDDRSKNIYFKENSQDYKDYVAYDSYNESRIRDKLDAYIKESKKNCTITRNGVDIRIVFDKKLKINGNECPMQWMDRIIRDIVNDSKIDVVKSIETYKKLGVRKQLLVGMDKVELRIRDKGMEFPIKIDMVSEDLACVEFAKQKVNVGWEMLLEEFVRGNRLRDYDYGNRLQEFIKAGFDKEKTFTYLKDVLIEKEI